MEVDSFKKNLNKVLELAKNDKIEEALLLAEELLKEYPYSVELLVWKGMLIQDARDDPDLPHFSLKESYESLKLANELAGILSIKPALELGNFEYIFNDDPKKALHYYDSANVVVTRHLKEIMTGQIECYVELEKYSKAKKIWKKAKLLFPMDRKIYELERELGETTNSTDDALSEPKKIYTLQITNLSSEKPFKPLKELPSDIKKLTNLRVLRLSGNLLKELPPEIGQLKLLQQLDLANNQLTKLPPELWNLKELDELRLNGNLLTQLPPEIARLTDLQILNLSNNYLKQLPNGIGKMKHLMYLKLSNNQLRKVPNEIKRLIHLRQLELGGNQLNQGEKEKIKKWLPNCSIVTGKEYTNIDEALKDSNEVYILTLSNKNLSHLDSKIESLNKLEELNLSDNKLTIFPPELAKLTNLKKLYLIYNQLRELPPIIAKLGKLELLSLRSNKLVQISPEIGKLKNLKLLFIDNNQLNQEDKKKVKELLPHCEIIF